MEVFEAPDPMMSPSEDALAQRRHSKSPLLRQVLCQLVLWVLMVVYIVLGALAFQALEEKQESPQLPEIQNSHRDLCINDLWEITINLNVLYRDEWTTNVEKTLLEYEKAVVKEATEKLEKETRAPWSFVRYIHHSVAVVTTVGYGNIAPKTAAGKVVTILYALMGIPLMLLCLTNIGDLFAHAFKFAYARLCCVLCRDKRKYHRGTSTNNHHHHRSPRPLHYDGSVKYVVPPSSKGPPLASVDSMADGSESESNMTGPNNPRKGGGSPQQHHRLLPPPQGGTGSPGNNGGNGGGGGSLKRIPSDGGSAGDGGVQVNIERSPRPHDMSTNEARVPIYLVLGFVSGYVCLGALIFSLWENWSFLNGAYFCFITLSTIGFGDLVPGTSILDTRSETGQAKLIICCFYLILGLSIIAMSFNLVQEEVTAKCKQIGRNLGILVDEDNDD